MSLDPANPRPRSNDRAPRSAPSSSDPRPTDRASQSAPSSPSGSPLSDSDRAILRALLTPLDDPRRETDATQLCPPSPRRSASSLPHPLLSALAAVGLDELDLPLWFAQPHIQDYIRAHRALEDFLDEQAARAAQREGRELLRSLADTTNASDATCHDLCRPRHSRASPSSNPVPTVSPTEQRLIATALLRAPAPRARAPRETARKRAGQRTSHANRPSPVPAPEPIMTNDALPADAAPPAKSALHADTSPSSPLHADSAPSHQSIAHLPLPDPNRPRHTQASDTAPPTIPASAPDSATPSRPAVRAASESALDAQPPHPALDAESPSREALNDLLPEDLHDASLEEMLAWAVSVLADPPGLAPQPHEPPNPTPPDTS